MDPRQKVGSAASWFMAIAAFSLVNFGLDAMNAEMQFPVGAYTPLVLAAFFKDPSTKMAVGLISAVLCAGFYFLIQKGTRRMMTWVMVVGFLAFACDTLWPAMIQDWMGIGLHGWALFSIGSGIVACYKFRKNPLAYMSAEEVTAAAGAASMPEPRPENGTAGGDNSEAAR